MPLQFLNDSDNEYTYLKFCKCILFRAHSKNNVNKKKMFHYENMHLPM